MLESNDMAIPSRARDLAREFLEGHDREILRTLSRDPGIPSGLLPYHAALLELVGSRIRNGPADELLSNLTGAISGCPAAIGDLLQGQITLWSVLHEGIREIDGPHRSLNVIHAVLSLFGETMDGLLGAMIDLDRSGPLSFVSAHAGIAADAWPTLVELGRTYREFQVLNRVCRDLLDATDPDRMYRILEAGVLGAFHLRSLLIAVVHRSENVLEVVRAYPSSPVSHDPIGWRYDLSHPDILCDVVRSGRIEVIQGWDPRYYERIVQPDGSAGFRQRPGHYNADDLAFFVPIMAGDRAVGVVCTGATQSGRSIVLREIERMAPFLHQVGVTLSNASEILERRRVEAERSRLIMAVEQAGETIMITDPDGTILYVNPAFEKVTGYGRDEVLGRNPRILKSGRQDDAFYRALWETLRAGEVWRGHFVNRRKDGGLFEEQAVISPVRDRDGKVAYFVASKRDVTDQMALEAQLRQAQKMDAIGTLAGGISHDFKNVLTAVIGYAQLVLMDPGLSGRSRDFTEKLQEQAHRATGLISQLLAFSRRAILERRTLSLLPLAMETARILERTLPANVAIRLDIPERIASVNADPGQMQQVMMNLCINAGQAMPGGGELALGLEETTLDEEHCRPYPDARPGPYVRLTVRDTGVGMPPEVLERAFEPFYTTKPVGEGTGLGLAMVYGIVKAHDGHIHVSSAVGEGSEFRICLPAMGAELAAGEADPAQEPLVGGSETLLVVEDEASVLGVEIAMLEQLGYRVLHATSGEQALEIYRRQERDIALVLMDKVLPRMGGQELFEELKRVNPGLKALLVSGYGLQDEVARLMREGLKGFVHKPFDIYRLGRAVRQALDG